MFFQLKEGFVVPAEVEVRRICTPEMACQHSAMLAAQTVASGLWAKRSAHLLAPLLVMPSDSWLAIDLEPWWGTKWAR